MIKNGLSESVFGSEYRGFSGRSGSEGNWTDSRTSEEMHEFAFGPHQIGQL